MELLTAPTKTDQVTSAMRGSIKKGVYPSGSRLRSVRDLAGEFGVSPRIVSSALETLEFERLVRREQGRGVFVEALAAAGGIEVYMLLWGLKGRSNNYIDEVGKLASPKLLPEDFGFLTRTVFADEATSLDMELAKIDQMANVKCVLANLEHFAASDVAKFQRLHCPAIFIGDSEHGPLDSLEFNRIILSPQGGAEAVELLARQGHRKISLLVGDRRAYYYHGKFARTVEAACAQAGLGLETLELPKEIPDWSFEKMRQYFRSLLENHPANFATPLVVYGVELEALDDLGALWREAAPDLPAIIPQVDSAYLDGFYRRVHQMIREVVAAPGKVQNVDFVAPVVLNDLRLGGKYRCEAGETTAIN